MLLFTAPGAPPLPAQTLTPEQEALHAELRALKNRALEDLNKHDFGALLKETDKDVVFTAMNNEMVYGQEALSTYLQRMLTGANRIVEDVHSTAEPDRLATIYGGTNAVATGTSRTHFKLTGGLEFDVDARWTADLAKEDGRWLITAFHSSVNMFDNPLLSGAKRGAWYAGVGASVLGLVLGFLVGRFRRRAA